MAYKKKKVVKKRRKQKKQAKKALYYVVATGLWGFAFGMLVLAWVGWGIPDVTEVKPLNLRPAITILGVDGSKIYRSGAMKGDSVTLNQLPPYVAHAVLATEDRRFYDHFGIDLRGLARAMLANVKAGRWVQGGSTITQQLAKNLFLTSDKTLRRKAQEAIMALSLERRFSKDDILEAYLNRVYFGAGAYGIDAASKTYFEKPAKDLSLWESAVLAGLLKAPSRYSPSTDPQRAAGRATVVVHAMHAAGYLTDDMMAEELKHGYVLAPRRVTSASGARYFTDWVINRMDSYMAGFGGDIIVRTTLYPRMQALAEQESKSLFDKVKPTDKVTQMGMVTLAKDGAVLAMIGGVDYKKSQYNRVTQAERQPGSAFKPFVYLAALEMGYQPYDRILDAPFEKGNYHPKNYKDKYHGKVTLKKALSLSLNTATVRLLETIGVSRLLDVASRSGMTSSFKYELATGLGAGEVNLLELAGAYAVIGNGGRTAFPYAILSIEDGEGNILYQRAAPTVTQVFARRDIADLDDMLQEVVTNGTARQARTSYGHAAGKTGTTQNYRDAWFVGYADHLVTGIWMGNDNNTPMNHVSGGGYPARLWRQYMNKAGRLPLSPLRSTTPTRDAFSNMLDRWSQDSFGRGRVVPSHKPVYNR